MHILVTGGAGFIGSNFIEALLKDPDFCKSKITVLDALTYSGNLRNLAGSLELENVEFVRGNICDAGLVNELTSKTDFVINFAAESHVDRSIESRREFVETNILGTQILLDAALQNSVKNFIQISTDEVYGSIHTGTADEFSMILPNSPYSASKASADLLVRSYVETFGLNAKVTRCTNNYGPKQHPEKLIPKIITNLLSGKSIPIYGDGKNVRDWIHVSDHCKGVLAVMKFGKSGEIYNISGSNELSNLQIAETLMRVMGIDEDKIEFVQDRLGHDFRYSLDSTKAKKELNFDPEIDFELGLASTVDWYKLNWGQ